MVIPETSGAPDPTDRAENPRLRLIGIVGAAILILAAIPVLGNLTSVDPESADSPATSTSPTTTTITAPMTTFGVLEMGTPIEWTARFNLGARPVAIIPRGGVDHIFHRGVDGRGLYLTLWEGVAARFSRPVINTGLVVGLVESGEDLLAYGYDSSSQRPTTWRSPDGLSWVAEELPMDLVPGQLLYLTDAQSAGDTVIISGVFRSGEPGETGPPFDLQQRLQEVFGDLFRYFVPISTPDDEVRLEVYGPLGMFLGLTDPRMLGIDPEDIFEPPGEGNLESIATWVSESGGPWQSHVFEFDRGPYSMFEGPDGGIWATVSTGGGLLTTMDGSGWSELPSTHELHFASPSGEGLVGITWDGEWVRSDDGITWRELDFPEVLSEWRGWAQTESLASVTGILGSVYLFGEGSSTPDLRINVSGSHSLWITESGDLSLRDADEEIQRIPLGQHDHAWVSVDIEASSIHFLNPQSGQVLMTLTAEDFRNVEAIRRRMIPDHQVLIFTLDGEEWTVQDLSGLSPIIGIDMAGDSFFLSMSDGPGTLVLVGTLP